MVARTICILLIIAFQVDAQEIPLHITDEGHLIIEVTVNDSIKGNFILDTGAGTMIISGKMFERIEQTVTTAGVYTGFRHDGDRLSGALYGVPSFSVGGKRVENLKTGVFPPLDNMGIDGLVSLKFFENQPFTIDFKNGLLRWEDAESLSDLGRSTSAIPISLHKHTDIMLDMYVPIQLNEEICLDAVFDTGSGYGSFVINPHYAPRVIKDSAAISHGAYKRLFSGTTVKDTYATIQTIGLCATDSGIKMEKPLITFREKMIYQGLVGSYLFKEKRITIDIAGEQMWLEN